jgi:hypothetical protein
MFLKDNMLSLNFQTSLDTQRLIAGRFRNLRTFRDLSRKTLSLMAGVPEASIKRFERTGDISILSLLKLAESLDALDAFSDLFPLPVAKSLDEIERRDKTKLNPKKKRGRL